MCLLSIFFFFKQKTAYEIRPCDWSSDVCSSDLASRSTGASGSCASTRTLPRSRIISRSEERRVGKSVRSCVDLGGRRIIKKKKKKRQNARRAERLSIADLEKKK